MAKLSSSEIASPLRRLSDVAATGEPLSITYAPSQPNPNRLVGPSAASRSSSDPAPDAPDVSSSSASTKSVSATMTESPRQRSPTARAWE